MDGLGTLIAPEQMGTWVAAILTLMVYSYLLGDNPLFRLAEHLLVASSVAYAAIVAYHTVLVPRLFAPLAAAPAGRPDLIIPLVLGLLLLFKLLPGTSRLGTPSLGYLAGIGVGLAVAGALAGTLLPQIRATFLPIVPMAPGESGQTASNLVIVAGTVTTLLSFQFVSGLGRKSAVEGGQAGRNPVRIMGRSFMMIAFGAFFGGAVLTYLSLLIGRWDFLINEWLRPVLGF